MPASTPPRSLTPTPIDEIPAIVARLRDAAAADTLISEHARTVQLKQLRRLLHENEQRLALALHADLGKGSIESYSTEIAFVNNEIEHTLSNLNAWMKPRKVGVPLKFRPGSARIVRQPLGVIAVIAPWNYPVQLTLGPMVGALAAGNCVVVKPSEVATATAALLAELIPQYLDAAAVAVVSGGVEETTALLAERFDHIVYTGNGTVARTVMTAAAQHLTPVTLELGGKSPVIVAADAEVDVTARRIAFGKFLNAGQTCIAPDYVLVVESLEAELLGALLRVITEFYGDDAASSPDYGRIVNERHLDRLIELFKGGGYESVVTGGTHDREQRYFAPTVLAGVDPDSPLMRDEIFGPILPVLTVPDVDSAVQFVNERPHPLALYVFSADEATAERVIERTRSGGAAINTTVYHVAIPELPFGGVGPSGMGAYHGEAGFERFSHSRSVLTKPTRPDPPILYPPHKRWKEAILRRVL